jgi:hypothetical protein
MLTPFLDELGKAVVAEIQGLKRQQVTSSKQCDQDEREPELNSQ